MKNNKPLRFHIIIKGGEVFTGKCLRHWDILIGSKECIHCIYFEGSSVSKKGVSIICKNDIFGGYGDYRWFGNKWVEENSEEYTMRFVSDDNIPL